MGEGNRPQQKLCEKMSSLIAFRYLRGSNKHDHKPLCCDSFSLLQVYVNKIAYRPLLLTRARVHRSQYHGAPKRSSFKQNQYFQR